MKAKTLKNIRKYWDYTFCQGMLIMRRKCDGKVREYKSIQKFLCSYIYDHFGMGTGMAWQEHKQLIKDKKRWQDALACNSSTGNTTE